jgi:hypothetical protein
MREDFQEQISKKFNGAKVSDVVIDDEFGNITAIVNDERGVDCGFIEDYKVDQIARSLSIDKQLTGESQWD